MKTLSDYNLRLEIICFSDRLTRLDTIENASLSCCSVIVQELCESRGGCPGLSVLTSLLVSVDVKIY